MRAGRRHLSLLPPLILDYLPISPPKVSPLESKIVPGAKSFIESGNAGKRGGNWYWRLHLKEGFTWRDMREQDADFERLWRCSTGLENLCGATQ